MPSVKHKLAPAKRDREDEIDRQQLMRSSNIPFGRFDVGLPELKAKAKRLRSINDILALVISRHKRSNPLHSLYATCGVSQQHDTVEDMASSYKAVYAFITLQLEHVFPQEFWGSRHNYAVILSGIRKLIMMRKRETVCLPYILRGFKVSHCTWLGHTDSGIMPSDMKARVKILSQTMLWFCNNYVLPLLRSCFYVTESSKQGNRLYYFRRDIWDKLSRRCFDELSFRFDPVDKSFLATLRLGSSPLRLIPKGQTFRMITNMKSAIVARTQKRKNNNSQLWLILKILEFERTRNTASVGSSVANPKELWRRLSEYKHRMSAQSRTPYEFFKADIKHCFDSINQDRLLQILKSLFGEKRYAVFVPDKDGSASSSPSSSTQDRHVLYADDIEHFSPNLRRKYRIYKGHSLLPMLEEHIKANTIMYQGNYYRQKVGIPQGSCLSTLLCSFFYASMERHHLAFIHADPQAILLRYVDDFLLITPRRATISAFAAFVRDGCTDFGCKFNAAKSLTTVKTGVDHITVYTAQEFPWCGYLFDRETLDVYADYSRYADIDMVDMLTINYTPRAKDIMIKLVQAIKSKQHAILVDHTLNSLDTLYRNTYESYLHGAAKLSTYCNELWRADGKRRLDTRFLHNVIEGTYNRIRRQSNTLDRHLRRGLFIQAFIVVLQYRQHLFSGLVDLLNKDFPKAGTHRQVLRMIEPWPENGLSNK